MNNNSIILTDYAKTIFNIWESKGTIFELLKILIENEVQTNEEKELLFRRSNLITKIIECYILHYGKGYLIQTLKDNITNIHKYMNNHSLGSLQETKKDKWPLKFITLLEQVWESILSSIYFCPKEVRDILAHIHHTCLSRYGDQDIANVGITSFFILRFFAPAIKSPNHYGITRIQPDNDCNKVLTLISNVIQKVSNFCTYEPEHEYFCLNDFVQENISNLNAFLVKIIDDKPSQTDNTLSTLTDVRRDYGKLMNFIKLKEPKLTLENGEEDGSLKSLLKEKLKLEQVLIENNL